MKLTREEIKAAVVLVLWVVVAGLGTHFIDGI